MYINGGVEKRKWVEKVRGVAVERAAVCWHNFCGIWWNLIKIICTSALLASGVFVCKNPLAHGQCAGKYGSQAPIDVILSYNLILTNV